MRRAAEAAPGLARIDRPVHPGAAVEGDGSAEGSADERFSLAYVRTRPDAAVPGRDPVVIVPGGPGLASAHPYAALRRKAKGRGLDVVMVEHRGVGLSRRLASGREGEPGEALPLTAMRIAAVVDDLRAVLDAEGIEKAVIAGSSYGTYVAQSFAHVHPERTAGLVLDSAMAGAGNLADVSWATALLYDGTAGDAVHRRLAHKVRELAAEAHSADSRSADPGSIDPGSAGPHGAGPHSADPNSAGAQAPGALLRLGRAVRIVYEFGGPELLDAFLNQSRLGADRLVSALLRKVGEGDTGAPLPYWMEFDRVGEIAFRELDYSGVGEAAATALTSPRDLFSRVADFAEVARGFSPFAGEPYDLVAALRDLGVPLLALSGDRDLRTPRPVARQIAEAAPHGVLLEVPAHGHSALDTHHAVLLAALEAAADGKAGSLGVPAGSHRHRRWEGAGGGGGPSAALGPILTLTLALDRVLPRRRARSQ